MFNSFSLYRDTRDLSNLIVLQKHAIRFIIDAKPSYKHYMKWNGKRSVCFVFYRAIISNPVSNQKLHFQLIEVILFALLY